MKQPIIDILNKKCTPWHETKGSAGLDLKANLDKPVIIHPNNDLLIPVGIKLNIDNNLCGLVISRSSLACKYGVVVLNSPGLIDSDFQKEIKVLLKNTSHDDYKINPYDRIAQLLIIPYFQVDSLIKHIERNNGFGSTNNGTGYYDHNKNPKCASCEGTGIEK